MDDRDRLLAILALRYSDTHPWNSFFMDLEPDYTRTVADLYLHVAVGNIADWRHRATP
jgi:hypothetical protein